MMTRLAAYRKTLLTCLILWASIVAVFSAERFFMLHHFVSDDIRSRYAGDLAALCVKGLLFDIKIASIAAAFPFLIGLFGLATQKTAALTVRILPTVATVLSLTAFAAALGNWFYFSVYDRQFDVFVFGLADEDTRAVLKTVWSDYPVIPCLTALIAATFVFGKIFSPPPPAFRRPRGGKPLGLPPSSYPFSRFPQAYAARSANSPCVRPPCRFPPHPKSTNSFPMP